jgi:hypothetical protein
MDQIVDIALQATKNAHRNFDPELKRDIADLGLQSSELLFEMTDILFTALDNVHAHSGLGERPKVSIAINAEDVEVRQHSAEVLRRVKVRISNSVDPRCITPANERKVGRIREQIRTGEYRSRVKLEGGTGLPKLQRIVAQDNRQSLEFGYEESDFFVQIDLFVLYKSAEAAVR